MDSYTAEKWREKSTRANMALVATITKQTFFSVVCIYSTRWLYATWETSLNYTNGALSSAIEAQWEMKQLHTQQGARGWTEPRPLRGHVSNHTLTKALRS